MAERRASELGELQRRSPTVNASCPSITVEKGVLQLDQNELVTSVGPYVRDELDFGRLRATAGVRADRVRFEVRDHFLTDGRDDSGIRDLHAVSPMLGLAARLNALHSVYANVASAFETPTTTELGNQADGSSGLNRDLKPQYSTTYETGAKGLAMGRVQYDVSVFDTEVRDELIPFEVPNGNGRTYYRNAGRTRRRGAEVELSTDVGPVSLTTSYALSSFHFRDFVNGTAQYAGNTIPGIPEHQLQATAVWHLANAFLVGESQSKSRVFVNDANAASASGFTMLQCARRNSVRGWEQGGVVAFAGRRRSESVRQALHRFRRGECGGRDDGSDEVLRACGRPHLVFWLQRSDEPVVALPLGGGMCHNRIEGPMRAVGGYCSSHA